MDITYYSRTSTGSTAVEQLLFVQEMALYITCYFFVCFEGVRIVDIHKTFSSVLCSSYSMNN